MKLSKDNKNNKVYTILYSVLLIAILVVLIMYVFNKFYKCGTASENFDNNMIVSAKNYDTKDVKYKDRVYIVKGTDFIVNDDSISLNGVVKTLKVDDIVIGEEAPGFMRKITKVTTGKTDTLLKTVKVDIDKVLSEAVLDKIYNFQDFVITGEDSPKFQITNDGIKMTEKFDIERNYENNFEKSVSTEFSNEDIGLDISLTGVVKFTPTITVRGSVGIRGINSFNLETRGMVSFDLEVPISIYDKVDYEVLKTLWPIGKKSLVYQWNIPIATGIWVNIKPSIDGKLEASFSTAFEVENYATLRSTQPFSVQFSYLSDRELQRNRSITFKPFKYNSGQWEAYYNSELVQFDYTTKCELKTSLHFDLNFLLWGFVGPSISLRPNYKITSDYKLIARKHTMEYGPGLDITIGGRFFSYTIDKSIYDNWWSDTRVNGELEYDLELPEIVID